MDNNDNNNGEVTTKISDVEYVTANVNDIKIQHLGRDKGQNQYRAEFDGKVVELSGRFWSSLGSKFQLNQKMFTYFAPHEVFERIGQVHGSDSVVRLAIEKNKYGNFSKMLAVSSVDRQVIKYNEIVEMLIRRGGKDVAYNNGIVSGIFMPNSGEQTFDIGGDDFRHLYKASFAVDGYGDPSIALALERLVCLNGMVAEHSAHTAKIKMGKDELMHSIDRALTTYANEEGYDILVRQIEKAQKTTASVAECNYVGKALVNVGFKAGHGSQLSRFQNMCGGLTDLYGEASLDAINEKFQQTLPSRCTVYDLLNFVTELSSHHINQDDFKARRALHGLTGTLLSGTYDLEGLDTAENEFQDLFITDKNDIKGFDDK